MYNNEFEKDTPWDDLHEECGVFGMYDFDGGDVASTIYYGLFALQHRGQESCGIAVSETEGPKGKVTSHKGMGLVNEVFAQDNLEPMKGDIGVGHVRYSTAGASTRENAQPLVLNYVKGTLALAHNGNLINAMELRKDLEYTGAIFQTTIDSEVIAYHIARERLKSKTVEEAVGRACRKLKGDYSLVVMSPRKLIGARDPFGFKPLCIGKPLHRKMESSLICRWHCQKSRKQDVFLNIFILQDRTAVLIMSVSMHQESRRDGFLRWIRLWTPTLLSVCRNQEMQRHWAIHYSLEFHTELLL